MQLPYLIINNKNGLQYFRIPKTRDHFLQKLGEDRRRARVGANLIHFFTRLHFWTESNCFQVRTKGVSFSTKSSANTREYFVVRPQYLILVRKFVCIIKGSKRKTVNGKIFWKSVNLGLYLTRDFGSRCSVIFTQVSGSEWKENVLI